MRERRAFPRGQGSVMRAKDIYFKGLEIDDPASQQPVVEALARALTEASVNPSDVMECVYYAAEDDLLRIMRLVATIEPDRRGRVYEDLKALRRDPKPA